jgi:ABC-type transporter Mla MlaB component
MGCWVTDPLREPRGLLRLPADCSIAAIRGVYDLVRDAFRRQDKLEIDCSDVDKADVTSVQLLISTARTASLEGRPIVLTAVSPTLRNTFQRAGVPADTMIDQRHPQDIDGRQ